MKISVSNIAWGKESLEYFLGYIKKLGCSGVEIAPSVIWPEPVKSSKDERSSLLKSLQSFGLEFLGFHALLYSRPDLQMFLDKDSRIATKNYIYDIMSLCSELDGKQLIFGSPKNRVLHGKKYDDCVSQAKEDFFEIAEFGKKKNVSFIFELPKGNEKFFLRISDEVGFLEDVTGSYQSFRYILRAD